MQICIIRRANRPELRIALQKDEAKHLFGTSTPGDEARVRVEGNAICGILLTKTTLHHQKTTRRCKPMPLTRINKEYTVCTYLDPLQTGAATDNRKPMTVRGHLLPGGRLLTPPLLETWRGKTADQFARTSPTHQQYIDRLLKEEPAPDKPTPAPLFGTAFLNDIDGALGLTGRTSRETVVGNEATVLAAPPPAGGGAAVGVAPVAATGSPAPAPASPAPAPAPAPAYTSRAAQGEEPVEFAAIGKEGALGALLRAIQGVNLMIGKVGHNMKLVLDDEGFLHLQRDYAPGKPTKTGKGG